MGSATVCEQRHQGKNHVGAFSRDANNSHSFLKSFLSQQCSPPPSIPPSLPPSLPISVNGLLTRIINPALIFTSEDEEGAPDVAVVPLVLGV